VPASVTLLPESIYVVEEEEEGGEEGRVFQPVPSHCRQMDVLFQAPLDTAA
jgi:hypothetical protein